MTKFGLLSASLALCLSAGAASAAPVTLTESFGVGMSFDDGPGSVSFLLAGLDPDVRSDLSLDFSFIGDLNAGTETFELFLDGTSYGVGCDNNTGNGNFGGTVSFGPFSFGDVCSQSANSLTDANLIVSETAALGLLADGALEIAFNFSGAVNDFVDINNGGETRSGVFFGNAQNLSFAAGGTVTYDAIAPIPVPPALPMLAAGLLALGFMRRTA